MDTATAIYHHTIFLVFVINQIIFNLTKVVEKNNNIYNITLVLLHLFDVADVDTLIYKFSQT